MCGICGVVALQRPPEADVVRAMLSELRHRGPDGEGFFEGPGVPLGHTRLAIIDLSDGGRQPFAGDDGRRVRPATGRGAHQRGQRRAFVFHISSVGAAAVQAGDGHHRVLPGCSRGRAGAMLSPWGKTRSTRARSPPGAPG